MDNPENFESYYDKYIEDPHNRRMVRREEIMLEATEEICKWLELRLKSGKFYDNLEYLAKKSGRRLQEVKRLMAGDRDFAGLKELADYADLLDCRVQIRFIPNERKENED